MKYFKNKNNQVFAYESDGSQDSYISEDLVSISNEEAQELVEKAQDLINAEIEAQVPQLLNRFQALTVFKLTKIEGGSTLYQSTNNYINSLVDDTAENITAKTAWETALEFSRDSALIQLIQAAFKLTDEQVDNLFVQGFNITA